MREASQIPVLVAGGAGFIGSHLIDRLLAEGHSVICLDNFRTGTRSNVSHLTDSGRFSLIEQDITTPVNLCIRQIYNLACPASPAHYQSDPVGTIKTNVYGASNLLALAEENGAKIFHASTSEVYGDPAIHPQPETYWGHVNPIGVRACYDEGKRCAEALFFDYHRQHKVRIKVGRIFNTYGPRMHPDDGRVVSNFIVQALLGEPITIYGDGSQTRSFCYVDDLVEAILRFMKTPDDLPGPINLGNSNEVTIIELAAKILALVGSRSKFVFKELPADDPCRRRPCISLAREVLKWEPKVSLEDGLARTIEYFDAVLGNSLVPSGARMEADRLEASIARSLNGARVMGPGNE